MAKKTCDHCDPRKAHHSEKLKNDIVNRLNRIEGQIRGVRRMIDEDIYCDDVLSQIASVQAALGGVGMLLLENHIKSCVVDQIVDGKKEVVNELMQTIKRMKK
ncbi:MAG TPA: metal-sensitive transcriptional regulator [Spirochaetota bacterium]